MQSVIRKRRSCYSLLPLVLFVQMWVSASAATKDLCYTTIQPLLDSYRPPGISALGFKKVSLGTVPPKVTL